MGLWNCEDEHPADILSDLHDMFFFPDRNGLWSSLSSVNTASALSDIHAGMVMQLTVYDTRDLLIILPKGLYTLW